MTPFRGRREEIQNHQVGVHPPRAFRDARLRSGPFAQGSCPIAQANPIYETAREREAGNG